MKAYLYYTVEDFADDLSFIRWAKGMEENSLFDDLYEKYPHKREEMDEAMEIIRFLEGTSSGLDDNEIYKLWKRIKAYKKHHTRRIFIRKKLRFAAFLLVLIGIGSIAYFHYTSYWNPENIWREIYPWQIPARHVLYFRVAGPSEYLPIPYK